MLSIFLWSSVSPTPTYHTYLSALAAVGFGALLAFTYTLILNKRVSKREVLLEFSSDLREVLDLCEACWLGKWDDQGKIHELKSAEHKLASRLAATAEYREVMAKLLGKRFSEFDNLDVKLFTRATGGKFQTKDMEASPETFREICHIIFKIEAILRHTRCGY
ncbi:hypothetical protein GCM10011415_02420 [Salipiger pallidus]|uniref:Uncharacterized protein n=1 Tax=Salipiger pallidus TaxID=1775170 RepID=A0A8J3EDI9_9RHOB|nr:hypothetical protein GCM10011415_02420 [Salipiger pallidus]